MEYEAPGNEGTKDRPTDEQVSSGQACKTEGEHDAPDWGDDPGAAAATTRETSPSASPDPVAAEDEEADPFDPPGAFTGAPPNNTPWSPYSQTVDQVAALELRRAKDGTGRDNASSWDRAGARVDRTPNPTPWDHGRDRPAPEDAGDGRGRAAKSPRGTPCARRLAGGPGRTAGAPSHTTRALTTPRAAASCTGAL
eukprot:3170564-Pyramimonas_sp.AAC.1